MVIAITGLKQSGKDTMGKHLINKYGYTHYAFADPIRDICRVVFDWNDRHFFGDLKEVIDPFWGISPRWAMQWIGTEAFQYYLPSDAPNFASKIGRNIWVMKFINWYMKHDYTDVVISDMRFFHELEGIRSNFADVKTVRIVNSNCIPNDTHASEVDIPKLPVDIEIENSSTFDLFYASIDEFMLKYL